jgi:hypothetical protein
MRGNMMKTTIGSDGQYELRERQTTPKRQLIRTADELVKALEGWPHNVALAMFRINRFGGQVDECNVLRHSMRVYRELPSTAGYAARIWALLHDAHEIITGDIVRPYKSVRLSRAQSEIDAALQARFCPSITSADVEIVRLTDVAVGDAELREWEDGKNATHYANMLTEWCEKFRKLQRKS